MARGVRDVVGAVRLLQDIGFDVTVPPRVSVDNTAAITQAKTTSYVKKARHLRLTLHFVRAYYQDGLVDIVYCPTGDMIADVMTKALPTVPLCTVTLLMPCVLFVMIKLYSVYSDGVL